MAPCSRSCGMRRSSWRTLSSVLIMVAACIAAFAGSRLLVAAPLPAFSVGVRQEAIANMILKPVELLYSTLMMVLPGVTIALLGYGLWERRDMIRQNPKLSVGLISVLLFGGATVWALAVKGSAVADTTPDNGMKAYAEPPAMQPHSGELVVADGRLVVLADPTTKPGEPAGENWRDGLLMAMTAAIRSGEQQVVMIFSRQGCPWCERQMPVLARAVQQRAKDILKHAGLGTTAPAVAFAGNAGAGAGSLLFAPLRIFIFDAGEFQGLPEQFGIQGFPTSLVFGPPGVTPMLAQGYLDDDTFQQIVREAAVSKPKGQRRKLFGLR